MEIFFSLENIEKCHCSECKVHNKSQCVKDTMILLQEKTLSSGMVEPKEFPALYCAYGKEKCDDLDVNEKCKCPECLIYQENDLESGGPDSYFCLDGPSFHFPDRSDSEDINRVNEMLRDYYLRRD